MADFPILRLGRGGKIRFCPVPSIAVPARRCMAFGRLLHFNIGKSFGKRNFIFNFANADCGSGCVAAKPGVPPQWH